MGQRSAILPSQIGHAPGAEVEGLPAIQRFQVSFDYAVYFTRGVFELSNPVLGQAVARREPDRRHRILAVVEESVARSAPGLLDAIAEYAEAHAERLELAAPPTTMPGGEDVKNQTDIVAEWQRRILERGMDRQSLVVAVGGGAMLDALGFAAATAHRGVRLVRLPTTVLAQADSGVGVKNAVNAFGMKNALGTFAPPYAVINDFDLLDTLPAREKVAGMAEAVKVALIRDASFFSWLEAAAERLTRFQPEALAWLVRRCAELHMRHIATGGDPFETGSARPLDFGHWAAHKLEVLSGHALRHGEAVAIGLALDTRYSVAVGTLAPGVEERVCALLERLGFRLWHPALAERNSAGGLRVLDGLREFREHLGGELTVTLLADIGRGVEVHSINLGEMTNAVDWLAQRDARR
jgi:3-dehydroquinate synthase